MKTNMEHTQRHHIPHICEFPADDAELGVGRHDGYCTWGCLTHIKGSKAYVAILPVRASEKKIAGVTAKQAISHASSEAHLLSQETITVLKEEKHLSLLRLTTRCRWSSKRVNSTRCPQAY